MNKKAKRRLVVVGGIVVIAMLVIEIGRAHV